MVFFSAALMTGLVTVTAFSSNIPGFHSADGNYVTGSDSQPRSGISRLRFRPELANGASRTRCYGFPNLLQLRSYWANYKNNVNSQTDNGADKRIREKTVLISLKAAEKASRLCFKKNMADPDSWLRWIENVLQEPEFSDLISENVFKLSLTEFLQRAKMKEPASLDWSTDGCSAPVLGDHRFRDACVRHDFGYGNAKQAGWLDSPMDMRGAVDAKFYLE